MQVDPRLAYDTGKHTLQIKPMPCCPSHLQLSAHLSATQTIFTAAVPMKESVCCLELQLMEGARRLKRCSQHPWCAEALIKRAQNLLVQYKEMDISQDRVLLRIPG